MYMPEHISGTGDALSHTGMEAQFSSTGRAIEPGHDPRLFIPEEAMTALYESDDYLAFVDQMTEHYQTDIDAHCEVDPIRQIKTVRTHLKDIGGTLDRLLDENIKRDRREQYMWAGLAGLAVVTLFSLFRK
ncbi:unnamed protein product [Caenorhabditis sp. 36 PRJEB53466]|nr:unnamed protein product [Caenorhabditis sp. 36 PRJEB53466]